MVLVLLVLFVFLLDKARVQSLTQAAPAWCDWEVVRACFCFFKIFGLTGGVSLARGRAAPLRPGLSLSYSLFWWGCMLLVDLAPFHLGLVVCWCVGLVLSWSPVGVLALVRLLLVLSVWGSFSVHWWTSVV